MGSARKFHFRKFPRPQECYNQRFLDRIYTQNEIDYCESKGMNKYLHYAGRFAAKEAIKKAILSSGILKYISMKEIEIISANSIPKVNVESIDNCIKISISHTDDFAMATAIIDNWDYPIQTDYNK